MSKHDIADLYIQLVRKTISACAETSGDFSSDIVTLMGIKDMNEYGFIIDSFYLLEDTQLAKNNFRQFGPDGPTKYKDFGEAYLRVYGVLNACYLQLEAVGGVSSRLGININKDKLKALTIFQLRHTFAAHTVNRGRGQDNRSYILDRHGLLEGKLSGYSLNRKSGRDFIDENVLGNLDLWDSELATALKAIAERILQPQSVDDILGEETSKFRAVCARVTQCLQGSHLYTNVWSDNPIAIVLVTTPVSLDGP